MARCIRVGKGICRRTIHLKRRPQAFTLMELLMVFAIVGVLIAMLLPAIQFARESARATVCKNNLKQLTLAARQFHLMHGRYPPGYLGPMHRECLPGYREFEQSQFVGLMPFLLPYLEEHALHNELDVNMRIDDEDVNWLRLPATQAAANHRMEVLGCPSATHQTSVVVVGTHMCLSVRLPSLRMQTAQMSKDALSNYVGSAGRFGVTGHPFDSQRGVFFNRSQVRTISDGESKTFLIGETVGAAEDGTYHIGHSWMGSGALPLENGIGNRLDWGTFNSWHVGIVHFSYADGSVHAVNSNIEHDVLIAASAIADGT